MKRIKKEIEALEKEKRKVKSLNPLTKAGYRKEDRLKQLDAMLKKLDQERKAIWNDINDWIEESLKKEIHLLSEGKKTGGEKTPEELRQYYARFCQAANEYYYQNALTYNLACEKHDCNFSRFVNTACKRIFLNIVRY